MAGAERPAGNLAPSPGYDQGWETDPELLQLLAELKQLRHQQADLAQKIIDRILAIMDGRPSQPPEENPAHTLPGSEQPSQARVSQARQPQRPQR